MRSTRAGCWAPSRALRGMLGAGMILSLGLPSTTQAQRIKREVGVSIVGALGDDQSVVAGLHLGFRPATRTRWAFFAGAGSVGDEAGGRFETTLQFLTAPARKTGVGLYAGGGIGAVVAERTEARIIALVGLEGRPGGRSGWALEGGVGGGWRLAAGWRWRR